jgi:putative ABC transport system ATP-binding protein
MSDAGKDTGANDAAANDAVANDAVANDRVANETGANEVAANKAVANEAVANEAGANGTAGNAAAMNGLAMTDMAVTGTAANGTAAKDTVEKAAVSKGGAVDSTVANDTAANASAAKDSATKDWVYELRGVCVSRTSGAARFDLIVDALAIGRGEMLALIGPSGSGKSTLLDLLSMVSVPARAQAFMFAPQPGKAIDVGAMLARAGGSGNRLAGLRRDGIGYVLQTGGLLPFLSVRRNIGLSRALRGEPLEPMVTDVARALGVAGHLHKYPAELSVGERQRVAIARALAHRPAVVLADEPTAALDPSNAANVMDRFVMFAREAGATIVLASHDQTRVAALGFRCVSPVLSTDGTVVTARFAG